MKRLLCLAALASLLPFSSPAGPLDPPDPALKKITVDGRVIQYYHGGLLVDCEADETHIGQHHAEGTVYVRDLQKGQGAHVHLTGLIRDGDFHYTTTFGAPTVVEAYKKP